MFQADNTTVLGLVQVVGHLDHQLNPNGLLLHALRDPGHDEDRESGGEDEEFEIARQQLCPQAEIICPDDPGDFLKSFGGPVTGDALDLCGSDDVRLEVRQMPQVSPLLPFIRLEFWAHSTFGGGAITQLEEQFRLQGATAFLRRQDRGLELLELGNDEAFGIGQSLAPLVVLGDPVEFPEQRTQRLPFDVLHDQEVRPADGVAVVLIGEGVIPVTGVTSLITEMSSSLGIAAKGVPT